MEIVPVTRMDEVLKVALTRVPEAIEWTFEDAEKAPAPPASIEPPEGEESTGLPH
jgi:ATP-dependent Lon protease